MGDINMTEDQTISHLMKGVAEDLYQVLINSAVSTVDKFVTCCREVDAMRKKRDVPLRYERQPNKKSRKYSHGFVTCINDEPSDLKSIIQEEVRSNLTPLTREKPAPSPYRTKRTGQSSWRPMPRPRQENKPTQHDTGRKTNLWRTSDNVPICFHCGRPGHVTSFCLDRRRVFSAARQRRQFDQYEHWDSDSDSGSWP
ncbi:CCHC-type domain-containing protein [Trichonephila clavipes]|nr:CCHC-type domain-containing protein [Trichonephila clavipes]